MIFLIIFITAFISTVLSSMSGAGASIISVPVFLALGISLPATVAINQISGAFWVLPAARNYLKGKKVHWLFLALFCIIGIAGVITGVSVAININQRLLSTVIGYIIVLLVFYAYFNKSLGLKDTNKIYSPFRRFLAYPVAFLLGFYEAVFGSGNGILFTVTTFYTRGFDFVEALGHYYLVVFFWVIVAATLYGIHGYVNISYVIPSVLGGIAGGYIGSKYARHKGNKFIKLLFLILGSLLGVKLIMGV